MDSRRDPAKAWRIFKALLRPSDSSRRPVLAAAISLGIPEGALAEILADKFARAAQAPPPAVVALPDVSPHSPYDQRVKSLFTSDLTLRELQTALHRCPRRRSAPGVEGVTYQVLRNLDVTQLTPLLRLYNRI